MHGKMSICFLGNGITQNLPHSVPRYQFPVGFPYGFFCPRSNQRRTILEIRRSLWYTIKKKIIGRRPQKRLRQSYSTERRITVMKRNLAQFLLLTVLLSMLAGCTGTVVVIEECTCSAEGTASAQNTPAAPPAEGALKTGLAISADISGSENAVGASFDVTFAAVLVDVAILSRNAGLLLVLLLIPLTALLVYLRAKSNGSLRLDTSAVMQKSTE